MPFLLTGFRAIGGYEPVFRPLRPCSLRRLPSRKVFVSRQCHLCNPLSAGGAVSTHTAACQCGQLQAHCTGEAARISLCHCLACQRRTGAPFSANSRFARDAVEVEGESRTWSRKADTGNGVIHHFCPDCGTTVFWELTGFPDVIAVANGLFADSAYPQPSVCVWEESKHGWTDHIADADMERWPRMPD